MLAFKRFGKRESRKNPPERDLLGAQRVRAEEIRGEEKERQSKNGKERMNGVGRVGERERVRTRACSDAVRLLRGPEIHLPSLRCIAVNFSTKFSLSFFYSSGIL